MNIMNALRRICGFTHREYFVPGALVQTKEGLYSSIGEIQSVTFDGAYVLWQHNILSFRTFKELEPAIHSHQFKLGQLVMAEIHEQPIIGQICNLTRNDTYSIIRSDGGWLHGVTESAIRELKHNTD